MKIDFLITALSGGGAERVMVLLANHFQEKGHTVCLITFNVGDAYEVTSGVMRKKLHDGKFKNHKLRTLNNLRKYYALPKNRPDVMISFLTLNNLNTILIAKLYGINVIVSEHISSLGKTTPEWLTRITRNWIYRKADFITVLTAFDIEFYKKRKCKVVVMPNPCTFPVLLQNDHPRKKTILAVGSLNRYHHKGFDNLIGFIKPILDEHSDWTLKIIGGGVTGKKLLTKLVEEEEGLAKRIIFTGFTNEVAQYMKEAAIFILPSRFEGLPMVLLEAMSQGMACIAYDCKTGPSDMLRDHYNGLLIPDQDVPSMQKGLLMLMENEKLRHTLGNNALRSLERYSMNSVASQWEELFKQLRT
ncbi:glycosyltransferase family 4 protein [Maribacter sp. ACAM166]|uniref:glycosyltransferase family 4 protein n=1 Tax=Maribacter sp. ACAM166 TaxID=2508996 RepID=UPI0010FD0809|nr:glycosyltransferase family 4 protein [Maribacter sp. ACAM166]TLP70634.1 glycosyltransferase family 4 protein [Maribacter sp. ACAM166]